jgi:hypothetical protein
MMSVFTFPNRGRNLHLSSSHAWITATGTNENWVDFFQGQIGQGRSSPSRHQMVFYHAKTILCKQSFACKLLQVESTQNIPRMGNISAIKTETLLRVEERRKISEAKSD